MTDGKDVLTRFARHLRPPNALRRRPDQPNLAVILDDFSTQCFGAEANLWPITTERPGLDIGFIKPKLLLVESAWNGNAGSWRYMVTSDQGPKVPLVKLLQDCRRKGIPTVFWNKEDPPHFHEFLPTAKHFDFILTTDEDMVPQYEANIPGADVTMMRFAASTQLHNPQWIDGYRNGDIAFAGQYFAHKFPERRNQMELLFPAAAGHEFAIFSRALRGAPEYQFPEPFANHVVGSLPYSEMVKEYRRHKVFLNVNSVITSRSMCARRVFELAAAKTAVVGVDSEAIRSVYADDEVLLVNAEDEARDAFALLVDDDWARRWVTQRAWRRTIAQHTYAHRMSQILELVGEATPEDQIHIHAILSGSTDSLRALLDELQLQDFSLLGKPVQLSYSFGPDVTEPPETPAPVLPHRPSPPEGAHVAWLNGEFTYGRRYLLDLLLTLTQQGASAACKTTTESIHDEERFVSELPHHGWLCSPSARGTAVEWVEVQSQAAGRANLEASAVYSGDPLELARRGDTYQPTLSAQDR